MNKNNLSIKRVLLSVLLSFEFCILLYSVFSFRGVQDLLFLLLVCSASFLLGVRMYEFYQTNGPTLNYKLLLITLFLALFVIALPNEKELHGYRGALTD